jgi:DNA-binding MarR family transcriptional regulator
MKGYSMNVYLDFLSKRRLVDYSFLLSADDREILETVALNERTKIALTVGDLMDIGRIASPATMHRRFDSLRDRGLLAATHRNGNKRTKYVTLTVYGWSYFKRLETYMKKANK